MSAVPSSPAAIPLSPGAIRPRVGEAGWQRTLRRFRKNPLSVLGAAIILGFVIVALLAPLLAHPTQRNPYMIPHSGYSSDPRPPGPGHPLGTTEEQFDLYYGVVWGARTAFIVALTVIATAVAIGLILGSLSGFYGGRVDEMVMRVTDIFLAFPGLILAVVIVAVLGPSVRNTVPALSYSIAGVTKMVMLREEDLPLVKAALARYQRAQAALERHALRSVAVLRHRRAGAGGGQDAGAMSGLGAWETLLGACVTVFTQPSFVLFQTPRRSMGALSGPPHRDAHDRGGRSGGGARP